MFLQVEKLGDIRVPYEILSLPKGEAVQFEYEKVLVSAVKAFKLADIAEHDSIRIATTGDGTNLTKDISTTVAGFKINDPRAIDPLSNALMFAMKPSNNVLPLGLTTQSRNNCFPLELHIGKEDDDMYKQLRPMFAFMNHQSFIGVRNGIENWKPMNVTTEADLSATWKMLGRGGGAKVIEYPCHCCGCHSDDLHHQALTRCGRWCRDKPEGWTCYHHQIVTERVLEEKKELVNELREALEAQLSNLHESSITVESPTFPMGACQSDPNSIHCQPTTIESKLAFSDLINAELSLRGKEELLRGTLTERREALRGELTREWHYRTVAKEVEHCTEPERALHVLMQCIPCVLHMEN